MYDMKRDSCMAYSRFIVMSIGILGLVTSCSSSKMNETIPDAVAQPFSEPHIAFFLFQLKDIDGAISSTLSEKIISKGRLKPAHLNSTTLKNEDWEAVILDSNQEELITHSLGNPFIYSAEVVNEDDVLERKEVHLDEAELAFRMPLDEGSRYLVLRSQIEGQLATHHTIDLLE